jgi:lipid II:glycine glycyltransferase (peptidoglycan interpeptide bridge formation enzyme)
MYSFREIEDKGKWDAFVDDCDPNTFLGAWAWGEVETDIGRKVYRLGIFDGEALVGALPAVVLHARRGSILLCPHGPLFSKDIPAPISAEALLQIRSELERIGRAEKCVCVRMCPLWFDTEENRKLFSACGFRPAPIHVYSELSWILDITPREDELLKQMKKNTRYGIRKAEKDGVMVASSTSPDDVDIFWDLYINTATRHGFVVYPRTLIDAEFRRFAAAGRARWYFAEYQGEVLSAALIVYSGTTAFYHHGASSHALGAITPGEALQWRVIQDAKARGLRRYNFWGVVPDEAVAHPWAGLSKFKKGFGGYAEAYLHAQDFPLGSRYWITWGIETARRWKRNV